MIASKIVHLLMNLNLMVVHLVQSYLWMKTSAEDIIDWGVDDWQHAWRGKRHL